MGCRGAANRFHGLRSAKTARTRPEVIDRCLRRHARDPSRRLSLVKSAATLKRGDESGQRRALSALIQRRCRHALPG